MSQLKRQIKTKKNKTEAKMFVNKTLLELPMLKSLIDNVEWEEDKLFFKSKLGNGFFIFHDNLIEFEIQLSFMGKLAAKQLENAIDEEFLKLNK